MTFSQEIQRTEIIIRQFIYCKIKRKFSGEKVKKEVECLLELSDEFLQKYPLHFAHAVKMSSTDPRYYYATSDEMLHQQERLNWGRFASLFTLGGEIAKKYDQENNTEMIEKIITWLHIATVRKLLWIIDYGGGWNGFLERFDKSQQRKQRTMNYVVCISALVTSPFFIYSLCRKYM